MELLSPSLTWFNDINGYLDQSAEKETSWQQNQNTLAITKLTPLFYENVSYQTGPLTISQSILYYS